MNVNNGLPLVAPRITPVLDPWFRPAVLANRAFLELVSFSGGPVPVGLALEQTDGNISHFHTQLLRENHSQSLGNFTFLERIVKFLLWSRGGFRVYLKGPAALATKLAAHYRDTPTGRFDSQLVGEHIF